MKSGQCSPSHLSPRVPVHHPAGIHNVQSVAAHFPLRKLKLTPLCIVQLKISNLNFPVTIVSNMQIKFKKTLQLWAEMLQTSMQSLTQ